MRILIGGSILVVSLSIGGVARADDAPTLTPTITGDVDGTYNYNITHPALGISPYLSYTAKHNTFLLNAAHLAIAASDDSLSYDVELDAGSDAVLNSANYGANFVDVQEAWAAYKSSSGAGFKVGKFVTTEGIEVIEGPANPTVSRGLLFGLAEPATLTGALATYQINDQMDALVGVVNGWDTVVDNNSLRTIMGKFGLATDSFGLTLSTLAGPEVPGDNKDWRLSFDATADVKLTNMDLWIQANSGMEQGAAIGGGGGTATWVGGGVQPVYHANDQLSIGARAEVFADLKGARSGAKQTLVDVSVAPGYAITDHLTVRCEARFDMSSEKTFVSDSGTARGFQIIGSTEAFVTF